MITNIREHNPLLDPTITIYDLLDLQSLQIMGADYQGYNEEADLVEQTSDGVNLNTMWDEFQRIIRQWNSQRNPYISNFTFTVGEPIETVAYPIESDFEEASEFGVPKGIRLPSYFQMGYDFKWYDLAIRYTWRFLLHASSRQLRALQNQAMEADNRLQFTRVMRAIFNNVTRTAEIDGNNYNVYPFYNADTQIPPKWKTTVHSASHQHYLTSGGATIDSGDLEVLYTHLAHHGYNNMNGYDLVLLVNPQEGDVIRTFTVADGDKYTFIPTENVGGGVVFNEVGGIIGRPRIANLPGLPSIGTWGQFTIVEDEYIPAGYVVALASAGEEGLGNPVGIREDEALRGLRLAQDVQRKYPLMDSYYVHGMGTGIRHRGGGVVMEITADASYDIPAEYA